MEQKTQSTEPRQRKTSLLSFVCVLLSVFCVLSPAIAVSWSPANVLKAYLTDNYPWAEIEISNVKISSNIPREAPEKIRVEKGPLGNAIFSLEFKTNKRITLKANVKALDWVVKSKRPFKKGHILQKDDIYISTMDITRMPRSAIKNPESVIGKPLTKSIIANVPIVEGMVDKSPMVKRGQKVILLIESPGLSITSLGKTKEKGYVGMPIKAINLSSKKEISGVLIDENTVKVEF